MKTTTSHIFHSISKRSGNYGTVARFLIPLVLACFALSHTSQAVSPPPDGCYPGFTTAEGCNALQHLTTGVGNTGVGWRSLFSAGAANFNTGVGAGTLILNTADSNTAVGAAALLLNTTGYNNTANGTDALVHNNTGNRNTAVGAQALFSNTSGGTNSAFGEEALFFNTGDANTAIGYSAGASLTTGFGNVCIGSSVYGLEGESNTTRIRNIGSTPIVGGTNVVIDGTGGNGDYKLGFASSSRRYKEAIKPMCEASETLFALKPVTFRAKGNMDTAHVKHYGLIAEDVAAVDPDLVVYNPDGKPETLRFDSINAMLLNEFLKEHRKVEEQDRKLENQADKITEQEVTITELKSTVAQQQKEMEVLAASLKEQDSKIQKVSARLELSTSAPRTVLIDP